tara:strand:- start:382 stop:618 length:237 start_codon:yes stop_codon:yes gene_type:complete
MAKNKSSKKNCFRQKSWMLLYGSVQLSTRIVSALSLVLIALGFCSLQKGSKAFNQCVEGMRSEGKTVVVAVSYCNGGQ